jgi:hypothetical protein
VARGDNTFKDLQSNFNGGEYSDLIGARPDLQKYYNALSQAENVFLYPEGGMFRRPGTRYFAEVKDSTDFTLLMPFEFNVDNAYILELGDLYMRVHDADGLVIEIVTPWASSELRDLHHCQSADVMFFAHPSHAMRRLNRLAADDWTLLVFRGNPPPTFEPDTDISGGTATLTPQATTGTLVNFTASEPVFYLADVARSIKYGASRAVISQIAFGGTVAVAQIVSDFPDTNAIPAGEWSINGSPNATLDPADKGPIGKATTLVAGQQAFRAADVGKYVRVYDGIVQIFEVNGDAVTISALIIRELSASETDNPAVAPAGSWTMESSSWSSTYGWPRTLDLHQGRLVTAATEEQPTTFWPSAIDAFDDFGRGVAADQAMEYTIAHGKVNRLEWLTTARAGLFIGDASAEHIAKGQGVDTPIGGDQIPYVTDVSSTGSLHTQPLAMSDTILFSNRFKNKVFAVAYRFEQDSFAPQNKTILARQIGQGKFSQHPAAYAQEPNSIVYWMLDSGEMGCLTFSEQEQVNGWTRFVTDGVVESVTTRPNATEHEVWLIVRRIIDGETKRYIEILDDDYQTDCGVRGTLDAATPPADPGPLFGLEHLEGETVDVLIGGSYIGQKTVADSIVQLPGEIVSSDAAYEVGLHYTSTARTVRPVVPGPQGDQMRGHKRKPHTVALELKDTIGGTINGRELTPNKTRPFSGTVVHQIEGDFDHDGYITIVQDQPYPLTVLGLAAKVEFASDIG